MGELGDRGGRDRRGTEKYRWRRDGERLETGDMRTRKGDGRGNLTEREREREWDQRDGTESHA